MSEAQAIPPERRDFHRRWSTLKPPLRPHRTVVEAMSNLLPNGSEPVLLLGVTPELSAIPRRLVAADWSEAMIGTAWLGDTAERRAILADWRALPLPDHGMAAAFGDGSLSMLDFPGDVLRVLGELRRVVASGGRAFFRCYASPEEPESVETVREAAMAGACTFHAFKLRLNMAVAAELGLDNLPCTTVFETFERIFPDREALARASGWSLDEIGEIDAYRASPYVQSYPSRTALLAAISSSVRRAEFVETHGYPLAERCPILVLDL